MRFFEQGLTIEPSDGQKLTISTIRRNVEFQIIEDEKAWKLGHGFLNPRNIKTWSLVYLGCGVLNIKKDQVVESWIFGVGEGVESSIY